MIFQLTWIEREVDDQFTTDICTPDGGIMNLTVKLNVTNTPSSLRPTVTPQSIPNGPGQTQSSSNVPQQGFQYQPVYGDMTNNEQRKSVRVLGILGAVQLILGCLVTLLGSIHVGLVMSIENWGKHDRSVPNNMSNMSVEDWDVHDRYIPNNSQLYVITIPATPVWGGLWFVMTGAFGITASRCKPENMKCWKTTFQVTSILAASGVGITVGYFYLGATFVGLITNHDSFRWVPALFIEIIVINEMVIAIISASYCCRRRPCCGQEEISEPEPVDTHEVPNRESFHSSSDV